MAEDRMLNDEILLGLIKANAGGGGGGTTDYEDLENLPEINSVELKGNKSLADLGIQDALTAGDYIDITGGEISVNREIPANNFTYELVTKSIGNDDASMTVKKYANGSLVSSTDYLYTSVSTAVNIDGYLTLQYAGGWRYTLLQASTDHASGYVATWGYQTVVDYTEVFPTEDTSGRKLIIQSELDDAMATKQDALTFDDTPTDGSNNPVKSNGIYDALATKANTDMVAADFNAGTSYTAGNYCVQDGKLYKFKNNHSGAWSAADVDEVKIAGELSSLKSGLTVESVTVTNSDKLATGSALWCMRMGKVVVVEYYIITATDCVNGDVLATLDLPANFSANYFNEISKGANTYGLNLKKDTKTLTADSNIVTGATIKGQLVGLTY